MCRGRDDGNPLVTTRAPAFATNGLAGLDSLPSRAEEYMSEELKPERLRTCPKCRSQNVRWYEIYEQPMYWDQFASGIDPEGCETQAGEIIEVRGKCRACQHQWKPKGVTQVTQLPGWRHEDA